MNIKIYKNKKEGEKHYPEIRLIGKSIAAVSPNDGKAIAYLFDFSLMKRASGAKRCIEEFGFSSDFANWDSDGKIIKLLVNFED